MSGDIKTALLRGLDNTGVVDLGRGLTVTIRPLRVGEKRKIEAMQMSAIRISTDKIGALDAVQEDLRSASVDEQIEKLSEMGVVDDFDVAALADADFEANVQMITFGCVDPSFTADEARQLSGPVFERLAQAIDDLTRVAEDRELAGFPSVGSGGVDDLSDGSDGSVGGDVQ